MLPSRRHFLRGNLRVGHFTVRPPWASEEDEFIARCTRCAKCLSTCPGGILVAGSGGFPELDFTRGECTFCGKCLSACEDGALRGAQIAWEIRARIGEGCIARKNVVCRSCGDACEASAVRFRLRLGGMADPEIEAEGCTGCGACFRACPVSAITMSRQPLAVEA